MDLGTVFSGLNLGDAGYGDLGAYGAYGATSAEKKASKRVKKYKSCVKKHGSSHAYCKRLAKKIKADQAKQSKGKSRPSSRSSHDKRREERKKYEKQQKAQAKKEKGLLATLLDTKKKDYKKRGQCQPGSRKTGAKGNKFVCDKKGVWQRKKQDGCKPGAFKTGPRGGRFACDSSGRWVCVEGSQSKNKKGKKILCRDGKWRKVKAKKKLTRPEIQDLRAIKLQQAALAAEQADTSSDTWTESEALYTEDGGQFQASTLSEPSDSSGYWDGGGGGGGGSSVQPYAAELPDEYDDDDEDDESPRNKLLVAGGVTILLGGAGFWYYKSRKAAGL